MSSLNDRELTEYAFKEAMSRHRHMSVKLKTIFKSTSDRSIKKLCAILLSSCDSRMAMLQREMKNLNIK
ncbi:MAG: hypothetical protein ACOY4I_16535 [Bacillota bacterium]